MLRTWNIHEPRIVPMNLELTLDGYCPVSCAKKKKKKLPLETINFLAHLWQCQSQNREPKFYFD